MTFLTVFKTEWILFIRDRRLLPAAFFLVFATVLVLWSSLNYTKMLEAERAEASRIMDSTLANLGPYNPHGAAHFGTYVFRPAGTLSFLDRGLESVTGVGLRLEGHVQNEPFMIPAAALPVLARTGPIDAALLMQIGIPALLLLLAALSMTGDRSSARWLLLQSQRVPVSQLMLGKTLAAWSVSVVMLVLILVPILVTGGLQEHDTLLGAGLVVAAYALYYLGISAMSVWIAGRFSRQSHALSLVLSIWLVWTFVLPKLGIDAAGALIPQPSRAEFTKAMREDRSKGLDGHSPQGERLKELEKETLAKYGVDSLSQLPINFDGLVMQEDEEYGNRVWDRHFGQLENIYRKQSEVSLLLAPLAPFLALRQISMAVCGTDFEHQAAFFRQAETYRRDLIRTMNEKHAFGGSKTGEWDWKATADFYKTLPVFRYRHLEIQQVLAKRRFELTILALFPVAFLFAILVVPSGKELV